MAENQGLAVAKCNFVANDEIWKDHVHMETEAAKKWPANWSFLKTKYTDLVKDDFPSKSSKPKDLPPHLKLPPITPVEKYIKVLPSPHPFPRTTTSLYGWRSSSYEHRLERYGGYARNRGTLVKQLNWPSEAVS